MFKDPGPTELVEVVCRAHHNRKATNIPITKPQEPRTTLQPKAETTSIISNRSSFNTTSLPEERLKEKPTQMDIVTTALGIGSLLFELL